MLRSVAIILVSLCLFSCNAGFHGLHRVKPAKPHIILKNGTVLEPQQVELKHSLFSNKIVADDTSWYYTRDVAYYGDHFSNYANLGENRFAKMIIYGKISVYKIEKKVTYSSTSGGGLGGSHNSTSKRYFLQSGYTGSIHSFRYRFINAMIPDSAPEKMMLKQFKQTRRLSSLGIYLGSVLLPGSIAYTAVQGDRHPESNWVGPVGATMITAFTAATIISIVKKVRNHQKLYKIIEKYDGY